MKAIAGLTKIDSGSIQLKKHPRIGIVLDQNCLYSCFTAKENMEFYLKLFGLCQESIIDRYLKIVGLADEKDVTIDKYSKGMKRRLVIARILAMDPDILIMDEPLDGLDVSSQVIIIRLLKEWVREKERCIIYTSHDMAEVESLCNRIGFIKDGRIAMQGRMNEILKHEVCGLRVVPGDNEEDVIRTLQSYCPSYEIKEGELLFEADEHTADMAIAGIYDNNLRVKEFNRVYRSLTDIYERLNKYERHS